MPYLLLRCRASSFDYQNPLYLTNEMMTRENEYEASDVRVGLTVVSKENGGHNTEEDTSTVLVQSMLINSMVSSRLP